ncbi:MAG TPA: metalloregulator ArsR/SmtB family transcription factor [Armatimonadota bacterium]|jgi:predicted transcriptional regulator
MQSRILEQRGLDGEVLFKALASDTRLRILALLAEQDMNINELGQALGIMHPTVSKHMQILEQAGLVTSEYMPGTQGTQKRCRLRYDRLMISLESPDAPCDQVEEVEMPIGLYVRAEPKPPCGLASSERHIGLVDFTFSFFLPERASAQLLWMADGQVEYVFPNILPTSVEIWRVDVAMEVCSEAPDYDVDYPSDITVWVNDVEVGTWTSPGDFGGKRGRLNPAWWDNHNTQYGSLKVWSVTPEGSYVDGLRVSDVTTEETGVKAQDPVKVRVGIKPEALHRGGFNLFGRGFGNHEQGLVLRLHHRPRPKNDRVAASLRALTRTNQSVVNGGGA